MEATLAGRAPHRDYLGGHDHRSRSNELDISKVMAILKYMLKYDAELDLVFQALADPTRRSIVEQLSRGPASVSELAKPLPMSLPAVHQHLQVLEASGLVRSQKIGRVRTCHLELKMLDTAQTWMQARREMWNRRLDRLDTLLASLPPEDSDTKDSDTKDDNPPTKGTK
jgi:DNA-binding transcriptional ArsR family regulator